MDKLRALQYFVAAAEEGSLSGAANRLHVSVPAVSKMVAALERSLDTPLFERTSQGLALTPDGHRYLEGSVQVLEALAEADEGVASRTHRAQGVLTIGAPEFVLHDCIGPALPRFHARYPNVQLELRVVSGVTDTQAEAVDVFLLFGWPEAPDFVQKRIAQTGYHLLASPAYWATHGPLKHPAELKDHQCLCFRNPEGTLLDLWVFEKDGEVQSVPVRGWLSSGHRNALLDAAIAGEGIIRATGVTSWQYVDAGRLAPALQDWRQTFAPPVSVLFRPSQRRKAPVRAFVEFAIELFKELHATRERGFISTARERPLWQGRRYRRASRLALAQR